jgi:hypothetical protein
LGEKFDPNKHDALFQIPAPGSEPNTVLDVQKVGRRVLTPLQESSPGWLHPARKDDPAGGGRRVQGVKHFGASSVGSGRLSVTWE